MVCANISDAAGTSVMSSAASSALPPFTTTWAQMHAQSNALTTIHTRLGGVAGTLPHSSTLVRVGGDVGSVHPAGVLPLSVHAAPSLAFMGA